MSRSDLRAGDVRIPLLSSDNWSALSSKTRMYLTLHCVWKAVQSPNDLTEDDKKDGVDEKALSLIGLHVKEHL